jgi:hypothetical protein
VHCEKDPNGPYHVGRIMDLQKQNAIVEKLEVTRANGSVSEFLISWVGMHGHLTPNVTVWRARDQSEAEIKKRVNDILAGLVSAQNITVLED